MCVKCRKQTINPSSTDRYDVDYPAAVGVARVTWVSTLKVQTKL